MATEIKEGLYYSEDHEWVRVDGEKAYIGITDYAQHQLGDIVFVELPDLDSEFEAGESIGVIESVKAVSDMHTPVSGRVTAVNEGLEDAPESLNVDPYGEHIVVITMSDKTELEKLMNAKEYADFCAKEE
ncbi:MAG: glycine cleavage system protein GcvH [Syntrophaceticus sp.]